jgi:hypothetical protein
VAEVYYYVLLFLISASAAFSSAVILRLASEEYYYYADPLSILCTLAELIATSDFIFLVVCVIMVLTGAGLWLLIDGASELKHAALWKRFPLSVIVGFFGAWLGLMAVPILLLVLIIRYGDGSDTNEKKA